MEENNCNKKAGWFHLKLEKGEIFAFEMLIFGLIYLYAMFSEGPLVDWFWGLPEILGIILVISIGFLLYVPFRVTLYLLGKLKTNSIKKDKAQPNNAADR